MNELSSKPPKWKDHYMRGIWGDKPTGFLIAMTIGSCLTLYVVLGALSGLLLEQIYGISGGDIMGDVPAFLAEHGNNLNPYRWMQSASSILIFGLPAVFMSYMITGSLFGFFRLKPAENIGSYLLIPVVMLTAFPIVMLVHFYASLIPMPEQLVRMEENLEAFMSGLLKDPSMTIFALNFLMIAILPAVCEELLFRGVLQRLLTKAVRHPSAPHIGILISGIVFGMIHGQVFKFLPIAVLGILLGYLYFWTKNLWFPILAHLFHNGIQVLLYFALARTGLDVELETSRMLPPVQMLLCTVLFVAVLYLFYNTTRKAADEPF